MRSLVVRESARYLGAASVLVVGGIHVQQYYGAYYRSVPTIGPLFLLSFVGAGLAGVTLLAPLRRIAGRGGAFVLALAALGGVGVGLGTMTALMVSEYTPLFGFMEVGYRLAIVLTLVFDVLTTVFLGTYLALAVPALFRAPGAGDQSTARVRAACASASPPGSERCSTPAAA